MRRFAPAIFALAVCGAISAGCGGDTQASARGSLAGRLPVVATTTQLTDFVGVVGGDHVDVYGILKPNVDAHDFEPSPGDIAELAAARVIVKNGVDLESWFDPTIRNADTKATIVEAATGVTLRHGEGEHAADGDPHIWQDPRNARVMVHNIALALTAADPAHRAEYEG